MKPDCSLLARLSTITAALFLTALSSSRAGESAASVKSYLLEKLEKMKAASEDFVKNSDAYAALINANGGSLEGAYKADPQEMDMLVTRMQANYKAMDKESRYSKDKSGRFQAVSRVSDMRGIMGSCQVMYEAVEKSVAEKDKSLAKSVSSGFKGIMSFLDKIENREKQGEIEGAEIDELATQAKEKTHKLVPQIEQSAAVTGVKITG
jgi:soluble cytochrome b562